MILHMLEIYILKIDKYLEKDVFNRLLCFVSDEKRKRINKFYRFEDAQRSLLGDVLSRFAIYKRTGLRNDELTFRINEYGKPLLSKLNTVHFNISHAGRWVVCAIDDNPVGIDVEVIKAIDFIIAEKFFSNQEYKLLKNQREDIKLKYFYLIWSLKESYIKAEGKGLSIPLNSFTIEMQNRNIRLITHNGKSDYNFYQVFLNNSASLAICSMSNNISKRIDLDIPRFYEEVYCLNGN